MSNLIFSVTTQAITFLPLALAISISYTLLRATDMTLDGSFVLGAGVFAKLVSIGIAPECACLIAILGGLIAGLMVSFIQRGGRVDPLLAGVLATFILASLNLILMGKPNINLLNEKTLFSTTFLMSENLGWIHVALYSLTCCALACLIVKSRIGLNLRALGDNAALLMRFGKNIEFYRSFGFALTNSLAALAGCLTAQTIGYADIGMGFGMTLTGIGAIILGQQLLLILLKQKVMRIFFELMACLIGVLVYFLAINVLLRFDLNPIYLKMVLGLVLIFFLRTAFLVKTS